MLTVCGIRKNSNVCALLVLKYDFELFNFKLYMFHLRSQEKEIIWLEFEEQDKSSAFLKAYFNLNVIFL